MDFTEWIRKRSPRISDVKVDDGTLILRTGDYLEDHRIVITRTHNGMEVHVLPHSADADAVEPLVIAGTASPFTQLREEIYAELRQLRDMLFKLQDHLNTTENAVRTFLFASGIKSYDGKIFNEDIGILDLAQTLAWNHNLSKWRAVLHYRWKPEKQVHDVEFDYLIFGETDRGWPRVIGVEFKDTDFSKAVSQAIIRRDYTNYQYVVIRLHIHDLFEHYWDALDRAKKNGIGVISVDYRGNPYVLFSAKYHKTGKSLYDSVSSWFGGQTSQQELDDTQKKILDFLTTTHINN